MHGLVEQTSGENCDMESWPDVGQQFTLEAFNDVYKIRLRIFELGTNDSTMTKKNYSDPDYNDLIFYSGMENGDFIAEHNEKQDFGQYLILK